MSEEVLKKATECTEEETMFYLSDDEFNQVWGTYMAGELYNKRYSIFDTKAWNEERGKSTGLEQKI